MKFTEVLRTRIAEIETERAAKLAELEAITDVAASESRSALTEAEDAEFERVQAEIVGLDEERTAKVARLTELDEIASRQAAAAQVPQAPIPGSERTVPLNVVEDRNSTPSQLADALVRSVETAGVEAEALAHVQALAKRHSRDAHGEWARNLIVRASDDYMSAFAKVVTDRGIFLTEAEKRALAVGTNTQGGFLVPTHLDPTIILTNSGVSNVIRGIASVKTLTVGNVWNGVTSDGATASWDAELAEVDDNSPAVGRVSVPLYSAKAFVAASFEQMQDSENLASEVSMILADAKDRLEAAAHATGSGSAEPTGIFTALDANTNVELTSTTAATIGLVDLQTVYRSVPVRWRGKATWLMNPLYLGSIQALGTAVSASFSTNITEAYTSRLLGRPVVESDEAPTTQTTTVRDNEIILGDFSNYVIVDKPGSAVMRFLPDLVSGSNGRPIGASGWFMFWRTGADSVVDTAFRLLQDKTSA